MKRERFTAKLVTGHKGAAAFEVPFDPAETWGSQLTRIRPGRRGHCVRGTIGKISFESFVVARMRKFWVLIDDELRRRAGISPGDEARITLAPCEPATEESPKSRRQADAVLNRVRKFCLSLPDTAEKEAWGEATFRVKDKIFVMFSDNHHHDDFISIVCNAPDGVQDALVASQPEHFYVPPYVGGRGWLGVRVDTGLPIATITALVEQAYRETAPKRVLAALRTRRGSPRR